MLSRVESSRAKWNLSLTLLLCVFSGAWLFELDIPIGRLIIVMHCIQTDIERSLPTGAPVPDLEWSPVVSTLRQLVDEAQCIKDDRESIEMQLKEVKCDMGKSPLFAVSPSSALSLIMLIKIPSSLTSSSLQVHELKQYRISYPSIFNSVYFWFTIFCYYLITLFK